MKNIFIKPISFLTALFSNIHISLFPLIPTYPYPHIPVFPYTHISISSYFRLPIFPYILISFFLLGCEEEITPDLPRAEEKLVVEGVIEQDLPPYVMLTKNASYFDPVDMNTLNELFIKDAIVTVSDGDVVDTLLFIDTLDIDFVLEQLEQFNLNISLDDIDFGIEESLPLNMYIGTNLLGEVGKKYDLKVQMDGKTYTSTTTIPEPVEVDSIRYVYTDEPEDSIGWLRLYITDPSELGNYYRVFSLTWGKDFTFVHPYRSILDDALINGEEITFTFNRGWDPTQGEIDDEDTLNQYPWWAFVVGDTVAVKLVTMDATHYDFWESIEQHQSTDGNPFATPISVRTNIKGGALGVWGGYGAYREVVVIDEEIILSEE